MSNPSASAQHQMAGRWALHFLGLASIYFNQPLLLVMGHDLHEGARTMGLVAVATQVGYAIGILTFVPLGDIAERRTLMMRMYAGVSVALLMAALVHGLTAMLVASVAIGLMASVTHIALPIAPELAPHERRGSAIGTVMTGLLLGVLLARTFAGWIARFSGWRSVFFIAAGINLAFVPILYRMMPRLAPKTNLTYAQTLRSLWTLFRTEPLLREACAMGALSFGSFSCFWTTLAFLLHAHYGLGPGVAGTFGVVGAAGALAAPIAGRIADKHGTRLVVTIAGGVMTLSYLWMWLTEHAPVGVAVHIGALVLGTLALDLGQQMMQVGNQTRIFGLGSQVRSRLNTIYMVMYFLGGALGSALSGWAWSLWGWNGVSVLALLFVAAAGLRHTTGYSRTHEEVRVHIPTGEREVI